MCNQVWFPLFLVSLSTMCDSQITSCPFSSQCSCDYDSGKMTVYCTTNTTFPVFTASDMQISTMLISGQFSVIPDKAFYMLSGLTKADITLQSAKNTSTTMVTFEDTFLTQNANGIAGLYFSGFNPVDLYLIPTNTDLSSLSIQNANLVTVAYSIANFPNLVSVDYSHNRLAVVTDDVFNLSPLRTIWLEYNNITSVDAGFLNWLQINPKNMLSLAFNPISCNSKAQWMANFAVCHPIQIGLGGITCESGETLIDYLTPFADNCYSTSTTKVTT